MFVFGVLYRQCIKFALRNALRGKKSEFMTFSVLKIAMAFLFNTSLLSSYQLDWGTLLASLFKANSIASSGDPTSVAQAQCIGLDLHTKMKLLVAAPFAAMLLPLPFHRAGASRKGQQRWKRRQRACVRASKAGAGWCVLAGGVGW